MDFHILVGMWNVDRLHRARTRGEADAVDDGEVHAGGVGDVLGVALRRVAVVLSGGGVRREFAVAALERQRKGVDAVCDFHGRTSVAGDTSVGVAVTARVPPPFGREID